MLYDNVQILSSTLECALLLPVHRIGERKELEKFAVRILEYLERDLGNGDQGGFFASEDADSFAVVGAERKLGMFFILFTIKGG